MRSETVISTISLLSAMLTQSTSLCISSIADFSRQVKLAKGLPASITPSLFLLDGETNLSDSVNSSFLWEKKSPLPKSSRDGREMEMTKPGKLLYSSTYA